MYAITDDSSTPATSKNILSTQALSVCFRSSVSGEKSMCKCNGTDMKLNGICVGRALFSKLRAAAAAAAKIFAGRDRPPRRRVCCSQIWPQTPLWATLLSETGSSTVSSQLPETPRADSSITKGFVLLSSNHFQSRVFDFSNKIVFPSQSIQTIHKPFFAETESLQYNSIATYPHTIFPKYSSQEGVE